MPAKVPEELLQSETSRVSELSVGDRARITASDMKVNASGECYLDPGAIVQSVTRPVVTIQVERREDGFHVTAHPKCRWKKRPLDPDLPNFWIPVMSITIADEGLRV